MPNLSKTKMPMPGQTAEARRKNFDEIQTGYSKELAMREASRCLGCRNPSCRTGCPVSNRIPDFLAAVAGGETEKAWEILCEHTRMPAICGQVCPHENQCEGHCIRGKNGDPVAIGAVERFVGDWARENRKEEPQAKPTGKRAAVVGAGPAGLVCARELARRGHAVTLYEAQENAGGVLSWGIPSFRLSRGAVQEQIDRALRAGVNLRTGVCVGRDLSAEEVKKDADVVFLSVGALSPNKMNIPGEELPGVFSAYDFLREINLSPMDEAHLRSAPAGVAGKVVVVGGGNVAMDAARCAVRLPQVESVTIVYRRSEEEMPACRAELNGALEEGVRFLPLTNPVRFMEREGRLCAAQCARMQLGEPDASGRRRPVEMPDGHFLLEADVVVLALGFSNEPGIGEAFGVEADRWGAILTDEDGRTSRPEIFAGGDAVTGAATVVLAMRAGMRAAEAMDAFLKEKP